MWICQLTWHFPILLDAATAAVARKGDKFLARWADIMTGKTSVCSFKLMCSKCENVIEIHLCLWCKNLLLYDDL